MTLENLWCLCQMYAEQKTMREVATCKSEIFIFLELKFRDKYPNVTARYYIFTLLNLSTANEAATH